MDIIRPLFFVLAYLLLACAAIAPQKHNLNPVVSPSTSPEDPRTSMERRVMIFATYQWQDGQEEIMNRRRDEYFVLLARDALDRHVHGSACRWIISNAKVIQERIRIRPDSGVGPNEMETLKGIASLDAQTICPRRPTKTN